MCSLSKLLQISGLLIAIAFPTGCYRTVATIHVNEARQLVVERSEDATDEDETPTVEETEVAQIVSVGDGYRLEVRAVEERSDTGSAEGYTHQYEVGTQGPLRLRTPSELRLSANGTLEVQGDEESHRYSLDQFDRADVLRYRPGATAILAVCIVLVVGGVITGAVVSSVVDSLRFAF